MIYRIIIDHNAASDNVGSILHECIFINHQQAMKMIQIINDHQHTDNFQIQQMQEHVSIADPNNLPPKQIAICTDSNRLELTFKTDESPFKLTKYIHQLWHKIRHDFGSPWMEYNDIKNHHNNNRHYTRFRRMWRGSFSPKDKIKILYDFFKNELAELVGKFCYNVLIVDEDDRALDYDQSFEDRVPAGFNFIVKYGTADRGIPVIITCEVHVTGEHSSVASTEYDVMKTFLLDTIYHETFDEI